MFGILGQTTVDLDDKSADMVATQLAASTYQSQLTASTVANSIQRAEQQFTHLTSQQNLMHENMHQIIAQINVLMQGGEDSEALTVADMDADTDVAGASKVVPKRHSMAASLKVVLPRPQVVLPLALPQR